MAIMVGFQLPQSTGGGQTRQHHQDRRASGRWGHQSSGQPRAGVMSLRALHGTAVGYSG